MLRILLLLPLLASLARADVPVTDLVPIPGGTYEMGREGGKTNPLHTVTVSPFLIDRTEVTNGQYRAFCDATGRSLPVFWGLERFRCGDAWPDHPVVGVNHGEATAYAKWAGKRLPTEAEWEFAARGGLVGQDYPNGAEADPAAVNHKRAGHGASLPVGSLEPNGYGLHDMCGNVREWVLDRYGRHYYNDGPEQDPQGPEAGRFRVVRGGGWYSGPGCCKVNGRNALNGGWGDFNVGFRCAQDAPAAE